MRLVATGQHPAAARELLPSLGLAADCDLAIHRPGNEPSAIVAAILVRLAPELAARPPALLIVQGDTASAFAGALAGFHAGVPVGHVEAGLRTGDLAAPFPEEGYRAMIARIARLHFAPTPAAAEALMREGIDPAAIHLTGNSGIDTLHATGRDLEDPALASAMAKRFPWARAGPLPLVLVTIHRRENLGARLAAIATGLHRLAGLGVARLAVPLHPNPAVAEVLQARLGGLPEVMLLPPLEHHALVWLLAHAALVVTDSGGLQEEAPALGVRAVVVREATERAEAVAAGMARLVPPRARSIAAAVVEELKRPRPAPIGLFGDGHAADRIASAIEEFLGLPAPQQAVRRLPAPPPAFPSATRTPESSSRSAARRRPGRASG